MHFLITAGGTREYIDPVRFISNASSGRMGCALAQAALAAGHKVTLITTIEKSKIKNQKSKMRIIPVETAIQMFEVVKRHFAKCDCLIMAAAVADYTPVSKAKSKIKKSKRDLIVKLKPTVDILKWAGKENIKYQILKIKKGKILVGFALEDRNLRANAERKLKEKNLDMIIANRPCAIGVEKSAVQVKTFGGRWTKLPAADKTVTAKKIIDIVEKLAK